MRYNPENSSKGGAQGGAPHICYATFNRWNDERNVNVNRNDNDWNDKWSFGGVPKLSSFLTPLRRGRVLPVQLSLPAAEHFPDFVAWHRERSIFFIIERLAFPKHEEQ